MFQSLQTSLQFTAFFLCVNKLVEKNAPTGHLSKECQAKYNNIATSLVHSAITGLGSLYLFYADNQLSRDLIHHQNDFAFWLAQLSLGYFVYDAFDCARINQFQLSAFPEMALHHLVVLACFGACVTKSMFLGLTMVAMLMEVNSIFLHSRTLCLYSGRKNTNLYRFISISNLVTMIVFRLMVTFWLITWFAQIDDPTIGPLVVLGQVGIGVIGVMNLVLMWRCIKSDYLRQSLPSAEGSA